jgi:hypothetical protein
MAKEVLRSIRKIKALYFLVENIDVLILMLIFPKLSITITQK